MAGRALRISGLTGWHEWSQVPLADRWKRVRGSALTALQTGLAAAVAWFIAADLLGHESPFFAPIAAVIVLGASTGQRLQRAVELLIGVSLGILIGSLIIDLVGSGAWQVGLGVTVAMLVAVFLGGGPVVIVQAASTGVLVATFALPTGSLLHSRLIDALIGGGIAVAAMALLLPVSPFTTVHHTFRAALGMIGDGLRETAAALEARDTRTAAQALERLRHQDPVTTGMRDALNAADETSTMAPAQWRTQARFARYADAEIHIERAIGDARGLARRAVSMLADAEPVPAGLPGAVGLLADAVDALRDELGAGDAPRRARRCATDAAAKAGEAYRAGVGFSGGVVVAQIRAIVTDLLRATGLDQTTAESLVREAVV